MAMPLPVFDRPPPRPDEGLRLVRPRRHRTALDPRTKRLLAAALAVVAAVSQGSMSILEHLDELRTRLIAALVALVAGMLVAFLFVGDIFDFMMRPLQATLPAGGRLIYTEPTEAFFLYVRMAGLAGVFIAAPVILWQLWLFVAPGLHAHEKRLAIPFVALGSAGFVGGGLFSHYVAFQYAWAFFGSFESEAVAFLPRIEPVFAFYTRMLLAFALVFQMPTLAFFLARLGVVTARGLADRFKYAVLVVFIVAAALTPSADPFNQVLMAGPMIVLYGVSIGIAWLCGRPASRRD